MLNVEFLVLNFEFVPVKVTIRIVTFTGCESGSKIIRGLRGWFLSGVEGSPQEKNLFVDRSFQFIYNIFMGIARL
ncbi:MAG: hypothetical protein OEZ22_12490 [Spirochaetia bacterium]|nr:hypothetical protein [Spirochaetia bacterium]